MGSHKPSLALAPDGPPLGAIALRSMLACDKLDRIAVVVNLSDALAWLSDSSLDADRERIRIVRCPEAEWGMSYSLKAGLRDIRSYGTGGVVVVLADQPFIAVATLDRLVEAFASDPAADYAACHCEGVPMPPVLLGPRMYGAIEQLAGDAGAGKLLRSGEWGGKSVAVGRKDELMDIDDPFQLEQARRMWRTRTEGRG